MKTELDRADVVLLLQYVAERMIAQESYFCELDSGLGDGDHGVTITRGFQAALRPISNPGGTLEQLFLQMGREMMRDMGGAIGPIYSMLFDGFAAGVSGKEVIDLETAAEMFEQGCRKISLGADVKEGQKTMFDALAPAARALRECADAGKGLTEGFCDAAGAAREGAASTTEMMAKKGRARFLREKSIGHMDAGAGSMAAFFEAVYNFLAE